MSAGNSSPTKGFWATYMPLASKKRNLILYKQNVQSIWFSKSFFAQKKKKLKIQTILISKMRNQKTHCKKLDIFFIFETWDKLLNLMRLKLFVKNSPYLRIGTNIHPHQLSISINWWRWTIFLKDFLFSSFLIAHFVWKIRKKLQNFRSYFAILSFITIVSKMIFFRGSFPLIKCVR